MSDNSILKSVRAYMGHDESQNDFNPELLAHINAAMSVVRQMGGGKPLIVTGTAETWADFRGATLEVEDEIFEMVKFYVFLRTKLLHDPPPPSQNEIYTNFIQEALWRIREGYGDYYNG